MLVPIVPNTNLTTARVVVSAQVRSCLNLTAACSSPLRQDDSWRKTSFGCMLQPPFNASISTPQLTAMACPSFRPGPTRRAWRVALSRSRARSRPGVLHTPRLLSRTSHTRSSRIVSSVGLVEGVADIAIVSRILFSYLYPVHRPRYAINCSSWSKTRSIRMDL